MIGLKACHTVTVCKPSGYTSHRSPTCTNSVQHHGAVVRQSGDKGRGLTSSGDAPIEKRLWKERGCDVAFGMLWCLSALAPAASGKLESCALLLTCCGSERTGQVSAHDPCTHSGICSSRMQAALFDWNGFIALRC